MRTRAGFIGVALALALAAACGGSTSGTPTDGVADASADSPADGPAEAATDAGGATDAATDAGGGAFDASLGDLDLDVDVDALAQDCMPIVAPDPVTVQGTLTLRNKGASPMGPFVFVDATVYDVTGTTRVAAFKVDTTTQVIPAGGQATTVFEKQVGTLTPQNACGTLACNASFVVELAFSGPGAPPGARARAKPKKMSCTF